MSDGDDADGKVEEIADEAAFGRLLDTLSTQYRFDFREYKRASLARRIRVRMQQVRIDSVERYIEYLDQHADEHVALFNTILINITGFFRDPAAWSVLDEEVLPRLLEQAAGSGALRLWCVGVSSGQEAYSAAILLAERLGDQSRAVNVKIYATDVDEEALATGRQGLYVLEDVKDIPAPLLQRYFTREGQAYRFRRDLRRWVIFGRHNVAQDPPLSHIDLVICRNVLIYFTGDLQERILARFHYAIREGGFLFLGRSESLLTRSRWFTPLNLKWRIFERSTAHAPTVAMALIRSDELPHTAPAPGVEPIEAVARLQRVVDAMPSAVMVVDAADTIMVWNAAAAALYEIPDQSAVGRKFRDLDISYRIEGLRARLEEVKTHHIPARMEQVSFARRSGETAYADLSLLPLVDGHRVGGILVVGQEATESARLKEQMSRIAEQHATAIEELQSTNEELETTNEELQSTNEELETTNEELQSTNEELETTVEELEAANAELTALNAQSQRQGADLKRLGDHQQAVLSTLEQPVVVLDREAVVTGWNRAAENMWSIRSEDVVGRSFWALPIGEAPRLAREAIQRVLKTGEPQTVRGLPFARPTGERGRAVLLLAPLLDQAGAVSGAVGVATPEPSPA